VSWTQEADVEDVFATIENGLRLLLAMEVDNLDAGEKREVTDFIDVREYGLALETFSAILHEERKPVALRTAKVVQALANIMNIDQDDAINSVISDLPRETRRIAL